MRAFLALVLLLTVTGVLCPATTTATGTSIGTTEQQTDPPLAPHPQPSQANVGVPFIVEGFTGLVGPADCVIVQLEFAVYSVTCSNPSMHVFQHDTGSFAVAVIAQADAKIVGQAFISPPSQILKGQHVDVTLRKNIINDGPWASVDVRIAASATPPGGCTVTPKDVPEWVSGLGAATVDEIWTIWCYQTGSKSFTFDNAISPVTVHVLDPNSANDSASTPLTVTVVNPAGGIAELPDVVSGSGWSAFAYGALAGLAAAVLMALTTGAWYARRRWLDR